MRGIRLLLCCAAAVSVLCSCSAFEDVSVKDNDLYPVLFIYGGQGHSVYLGKLNTSTFDNESIWNPYGTYGNRYNTKCIWNEYGTYGGEYNSDSPFNEYASNPPILVDANGKSYGYFTCNKYKAGRCTYSLVDIICEHVDDIRKDVRKWYEKIFE